MVLALLERRTRDWKIDRHFLRALRAGKMVVHSEAGSLPRMTAAALRYASWLSRSRSFWCSIWRDARVVRRSSTVLAGAFLVNDLSARRACLEARAFARRSISFRMRVISATLSTPSP